MDEKSIKLFELKEDHLNELIIDLGNKLCWFSEDTLKRFNKTKKHFIMLRSMVLEFHLLIEYNIEQYIVKYFIDEHGPLPDPREYTFYDVVIKNRNFTFESKVQVLKKIFKPRDKKLFKKIADLNKIRNAFAHGYQIEDKKFNYLEKGNIFYKNNAASLIEDAFDIIDDITKGIDLLKSNKALREALKREGYSSLLALVSKDKDGK
ncbi:MAG: hypothetical protein AMJ95_05685 [Omnitrophica WOR_2 bacterium SM23_72]|nr:MAG: hypothetical protein AMJ95_05685 [Omnitrophica WOR_2 bacterium SM23_72]